MANEKYNELSLLYDPVYFLKNNWCNEKTQRLRYVEPKAGKTAIVAWKELVSNDERESECAVRQMSILFAAFYPTNFEKQKVTLALQVFKEKTVVALDL